MSWIVAFDNYIDLRRSPKKKMRRAEPEATSFFKGCTANFSGMHFKCPNVQTLPEAPESIINRLTSEARHTGF
ncbi:hypothetical protein DMR_01030 [Solidesulfovibrio magneticus RS-1]|uniref:Uncharacterized protein n=1 Tax=Solidesulfovibrio magneticus (strain ATCC 700980 / DSM 13731 / RS-1) TaxID=573370 RepID=C4XTS9_SOLM1|nr:hypothetical protein DMR_01030 [Solidesulfovibrio magneticus RS-1]